MSGLEHLEKRIRATATEGFVIGALVGLMGLGLAALAGVAPGEMELSQRLFIAAMAIGGCIAGWMIISGARSNPPPTETRVYKALAGDGKDVAHVKALSKGGTNKDGVRVESPAKNRSYKRNPDGSMK